MNENYNDVQLAEETRGSLVERGITLTKIMIAVTVIIYVVTEIAGDTQDAEFMRSMGALWTMDVIEGGEYYRLVSPIFLHFGAEHVFSNVVLWYFIGDIIEKEFGRIRYFVVFMISGIAGNALTMAWEIHTGEYAVSAGASGAVFGILGAVLYMVVINKGHYKYISIKRLAFFILLNFVIGFGSTGINYIAHAGGFAAGFMAAAVLGKRPKNIYPE